jgi:flagellar hook assembly protein FlgD
MVQLRIYDAAGRAVRTLVEGVELAGTHEAFWDGRDDAGEALPSGLYFYRLHSADGSVSRKMMLLK